MPDALDYLPTLELWIRTMRTLETAMDDLRVLVGSSNESPLPLAIAELQSAYTSAVSDLVGLPEQDVLASFWLEQNLGKSAYKIKLKDDSEWREITDCAGLAELAKDWNAS